LLKISNIEIAKTDNDIGKLKYLYDTVDNFMSNLLGFNINDFNSKDSVEEDLIELLIELRNNYRKEKNFAMSDKIRDELKSLGIIIKDAQQGTGYSKII
jgi:cysteinyl-tRNA synthetase